MLLRVGRVPPLTFGSESDKSADCVPRCLAASTISGGNGEVGEVGRSSSPISKALASSRVKAAQDV